MSAPARRLARLVAAASLSLGLSLGLFGAALPVFIATPAHADCPVVTAAESPVLDAQPVAAGERCVIEAGGSLEQQGNGINLVDDNGAGVAQVVNFGLIDSGPDQFTRGIFSAGNVIDLDLENSGIIRGNVQAILTRANDIERLINNSTGLIESDLTLSGSIAVRTRSTLVDANNAGTIAGGAFAIWARDIGQFVNTGTIVAGDQGLDTQYGAAAVRAGINNETVAGRIETFINTETGRVIGKDLRNGIAAITNEGFETSGSGSIGLLDNAGVIIGAEGLQSGQGLSGVYADREIAELINRSTGIISGLNRGVVLGGPDEDGSLPVGSPGRLLSLINDGLIEARNPVSGNGASQGVLTWILGTAVNNGTIRGDATGFAVIDTAEAIVNEGKILGVNDVGLRVFGLEESLGGGVDRNSGTLERLMNSGSIVGGEQGILARHIVELTNRGKIWGKNGVAIQELDEQDALPSDTILNLLAGSNIEGLVDLGDGINTLNVGDGLSMATTFATPPRIGSIANPFLINGNQVVVFDAPPIFGYALPFLDVTSAEILDAIDAQGRSFDSDPSPIPVLAYADGSMGAGALPLERDDGWQRWARATGVVASVDNTLVESTDQVHASVISGVERSIDLRRTTGVFAGYSESQFLPGGHDVGDGAEAFFTGTYLRERLGAHQINVSATGGWIWSSDYEREIANNMVAGGLETAEGSYEGFFSTLGVSATSRIENPISGLDMEPLVRVGYSGHFIEGFTESGAASALTFDDRDIHLLDGRAQLTVPLTVVAGETGRERLEVRGGVDGQILLGGDTMSFTLDGLPSTSFTVTENDTKGSVFAALGYQFERDDQTFAVNLDLEGRVDSNGDHRVKAVVGGQFRF